MTGLTFGPAALAGFNQKEEKQDRRQDAIYREAVRLVEEETAEVLNHLYMSADWNNRFENAVKIIACSFSTSSQQLAADDIADLLHLVAMTMAEKEYVRLHGG